MKTHNHKTYEQEIAEYNALSKEQRYALFLETERKEKEEQANAMRCMQAYYDYCQSIGYDGSDLY